MVISPALTGRPVGRGGSLTLTLIATCQFMLVLDGTIMNIALPKIQASLHLPVAGLSWVVNSYTLTFGGLLLLGGRAGDMLGRRRVFTSGVLLFTLASLAGGLAVSGAWLFAARAAQGAGAAMASPAALALIAVNFADGPARNRAIGVYASVSGLAMAVGMVAGGVLAGWASWRWVLFINVPPGLAIVALAPMVLRESPRQPGRFDLAGGVSSTAGAAALVYGFIHASSAGWGDPLTATAFLAGALLLGAFAGIETRARQPIVPLHLLTDRYRDAALLIRLLATAALIGSVFLLTLFVQDIMGFSPVRTGIAFLPTTAAMVAGGRVAPWLLARTGPRVLMISGAAITAAGMTWLSFISAATGYLAGILGPIVLFGLGLGLLLVAMTRAAMAGVRAQESGAASGLLNWMQQAGGALGVAAMVTATGRAAVTAAHLQRGVLASGITRAFTLGAAITGCVLLLALVPPQRQVAGGSGSRNWSRSSEK